jgi:uncharacterized coiled-coil protein SlyX
MNRYAMKFVLMLLCAIVPIVPASAQSDEDRIRMLEEQLARQQAMMEQQQQTLRAMANELRALKTRAPAETPAAKMQPPPAEEADWDDKAFTFNYYGHIQLDNIYDFKRVEPDYNSTLRPSTIPTQSGEFGDDGETILSVKQTQLGFRSELDTPLGRVKSWFEFDLFGTGSDAGKTTFSLRHAWVELGGLGFGQTNSNFMDISIFPNVVDWWGPAGMVFNRNPQLRFTYPIGDSSFAIALEKPNGSFNAGIFGEQSPEFGEAANATTPLPDRTAHYRSVHDWGHVQIAGVLRKLEFETRGTPGNDPDGSETGWGVNLTSVINSFGSDQIKLGVVYGEGIASFMNDGGVNLAPEDFEAKAVEVLGVTAYYDRYWSDRWSSSLGFSVHDEDTLNQQADFEFDKSIYASGNLLYTPHPNLLFGIEALFGELEDVGGRTGRDYRTQFTFKHKFSGGR